MRLFIRVLHDAHCLLEIVDRYSAHLYQDGPDANAVVDMICTDDVSGPEDDPALPVCSP